MEKITLNYLMRRGGVDGVGHQVDEVGKWTECEDDKNVATRERCMSNVRNFKIPSGWKPASPSVPSAAVLVPMCNVDNRPSLLYTRRITGLRTHSGQISFPGGRMEKTDTPIEAAIREAHREIGLSPTKIDIWGYGQPLPSVHQKVNITPVIGTILDMKKEYFNIGPQEIAEIFTIPIELLIDPKIQFYTQYKNGYIMPVFAVEEYKIWGITAYITHKFLKCLLPREAYKNEFMKKKIEIKTDDEVDIDIQ